MELKDLYGLKGEIVTQMEVLQGRLQEVNKQIVAELSRPKAQEPKPEPQKNPEGV